MIILNVLYAYIKLYIVMVNVLPIQVKKSPIINPLLKLQNMTAKKNNTINVAFQLSFFQELIKALSLEQMQTISEFLNQEI